MNVMQSFKSWILTTVIALFLVSYAGAAVPDGLVDDLASIDGVVISVSGTEVLIDASAIKGVRVGDLFTVVGPSEKIIHPQTGAVLGERQQTVGLLQVMQVRPGFSVTRQLSGDAPQVGATVQRNLQVEARLVDRGDQGEQLAAELRQALPQFTWQTYRPLDQDGYDAMRVHGSGLNGLLFLLDGQRLELRGPEFELLHSYDHVDLQPTGKAAVPVVSAVAAAATPEVKQEVVVATGAETAIAQASGALRATWSGLPASKLPVGLVVADLDADGKNEIARLFVDRIEIGRLIGETYTELQEIEVPGRRKGLALAALDLNKNGQPELFVTTAGRGDVRSEVIEFRDGRYRIVVNQISWFLNVVDLPGEGSVLLGQEHDNSYRGFAPNAFRLAWQGDTLVAGAPLVLPKRGSVYGLAALPQGGANMLRIDDEGRLEVSAANREVLWLSAESGVTESGYEQPDPNSPGGVDALINDIFLPGPLTTDGPGTVLTVMNRGVTASGLFRQMDQATITDWNWDGIEMKPLWTQQVDGYIPALQVADANNDGKQDLAVLLAFPSGNPFGSRKSVLRLYSFD